MIRTYVQLDDRVRPLAKIVKYWTKRRLLNDAGKHSVFQSRDLPTNLSYSFRWHNQFLHLDMYDHQLPSKTKSANPAFITEDARRQAVHRQRQTFGFRRRCRINTRMRQREQGDTGRASIRILPSLWIRVHVLGFCGVCERRTDDVSARKRMGQLRRQQGGPVSVVRGGAIQYGAKLGKLCGRLCLEWNSPRNSTCVRLASRRMSTGKVLRTIRVSSRS